MMASFPDTGCSLISVLMQKLRSLFVCSVNAIRYFQWPYCSHIAVISTSCTYGWSSSFVQLESQNFRRIHPLTAPSNSSDCPLIELKP